MTALSRLKQLAEAATPGPWEAYGTWVAEVTAHAAGDPEAPDTRLLECDEFNADYIAAANPQTILALLALVEAGQKIRDRLEADIGLMPPDEAAELLSYDAARQALEEMLK